MGGGGAGDGDQSRVSSWHLADAVTPALPIKVGARREARSKTAMRLRTSVSEATRSLCCTNRQPNLEELADRASEPIPDPDIPEGSPALQSKERSCSNRAAVESRASNLFGCGPAGHKHREVQARVQQKCSLDPGSPPGTARLSPQSDEKLRQPHLRSSQSEWRRRSSRPFSYLLATIRSSLTTPFRRASCPCRAPHSCAPAPPSGTDSPRSERAPHCSNRRA